MTHLLRFSEFCTLAFLIATMAQAEVRVTKTQIQSELYKLALANVVRIELWRNGELEKLGSGFFAKEDGTIITNAHVVEDALKKHYRVKVKRSNGATTENVYVGNCRSERNVDLCALKLSDKPLHGQNHMRLLEASITPKNGTEIYSMGHPRSVPWAMSKGEIRSRIKHSQAQIELVTVSSPIAPGSSGGPVMNQYGDVLGVVSSQATAANDTNAGIAISHRELREFLKEPMTFQLLEVKRALSTH